jgi:Fe-Mn family superoxide dismutase
VRREIVAVGGERIPASRGARRDPENYRRPDERARTGRGYLDEVRLFDDLTIELLDQRTGGLMRAHGFPIITRRTALALLGAAASLPLAATRGAAMAQASGQTERPRIYRGDHAPKPLPFDPKGLAGLSERLIISHHANNYTGAVKRLNAIEAEIAALPRDAAPFQLGSLKREALLAANSMRLHELYFANLGGKGVVGGPFTALAQAQFGSLEAWEHDFRLTGLSLAGGSGWVIATYDAERSALHNVWAWDHMHGFAGGVPLLVMDMYEHSYQMDYGADARGYVDAFFANLRSEEVDRRLGAASARPDSEVKP